MPKMSFKKTAATPAKKKAPAKKAASEKSAAKKAVKTIEVQPEETSTELAQAEHNPPAITNTPIGAMSGELDSDDMTLPRLNIVNAMSKLHTEDDFPIGCFVLEKELQIGDKDCELEFAILVANKTYQQKLDFEDDEEPLILDTKAQVLENGGTTRYSQDAIDEARYYEPKGDFILALKAPEGVPEDQLFRFPIEYEGDNWCLAMLTVNGSSYRSFAKPIATQAQGRLRNRLHHGGWTLTSGKRTSAKGTWHVPVSKFYGVIDDAEHIAFLESLLSSAE